MSSVRPSTASSAFRSAGVASTVSAQRRGRHLLVPRLFFAFGALLLAAAGASAQTITWGTPQTITGVSDIATNGTYVDAMNFALPAGSGVTNYQQSYTTQTIGDTTFNASVLGGTATTANTPTGFTISGAQYIATDNSHITAAEQGGFKTGSEGGSNFATASPSSSAYSIVLSNSGYLNSNLANAQKSYITLSNLTVGSTYQMQLWSFYLQTGSDNTTYFTGSPNTVVLNPNLGTSTAGGQFVFGTFTASSSTFTFSWGYSHTGSGGADSANLNDLALRLVPEPCSGTLMLACVGGPMLIRRRRAV